MNNKKISVILVLLPLLIVSFLRTAQVAVAESIEITVDGNGSSSENSANVTVTNETTVAQNNEANVDNNVEANADTGNNTAANNGGDTNISTGDITTDTNVANEMNTNAAENCNCDGSLTEIKISGNGAGSTNVTNLTNNQNTGVTQNNTANITNHITVNANTGNNTAAFNSGSVRIETGSIYDTTNILNTNINNNYIKGFTPNAGSINVNISGNGVYSTNLVYLSSSNDYEYISNNFFNLENIVLKNLNTGGNNVYGNTGDVWIKTGDIISTTNIVNQGNSNSTVLVCDPADPQDPGQGGDNPPANNSSSGSSVSSGSNNGQVLGASAGEVLPETGSLWLFALTLIILGFFISGWFLRFSSGVSPPVRV